MAWKLGLDLGTNSIGWTVFTANRPDPAWNEWLLADAGVRIIPDGREPAREDRVGDSLAVTRRLARGMRRNRDHGINRIRSLIFHLIGLGLLPADGEDHKPLIEKSPYGLRDRTVDGDAAPAHGPPHELGRVLLHLGLRRGFKSNRKTDSGDEKTTEFGERIGLLHRALKFHAIDKATLDQLGEDAVPPEKSHGPSASSWRRACERNYRCAFAARRGISIQTAPCMPTNSSVSGRRPPPPRPGRGGLERPA